MGPPPAAGRGDSPPRLLGRGGRARMMAGLATVLLFLLRQAAAQDGQSMVAGAVDGTAYLQPGLPDPAPYHQIYWRYENSRKIAVRLWQQPPTYPDPAFHERLELSANNTLCIRHLRKSDSGTYWLYQEDEAGKERTESVRLAVHERVPKPTVRAEVRASAEHCEATLTCSVALEDVVYEWLPPQQLPVSGSARLTVAFVPGVENYTCRVRNAVSTSSASLTYRYPCSWEAERSAASTTQKTEVLMTLAFLLLLLFLLA
ncbi:uncharacterized protein LOC112993064 [Dromaius novaehollandiae]|uniref:uncharacterized protein LOC112993064 n=1 Tax=Dromaius novaehollandiae TaxID=8790 RepID=UPI00311DD125